jgi:23S rRNA (pseudouridine1915-N3)-methyltransferase
MKVKLICVGKTNKTFLIEGEAIYTKRLQKYFSFQKIEIPDLKNAKNLSQGQIKEKEGELILEKLKEGDYIVLLDEKGKSLSSQQFADFLQQKFHLSAKNLIFIVGGPYGFSQAIYQKANAQISLSNMTFSHQMIRLFFSEQLYRAMAILNNEPYHHE